MRNQLTAGLAWTAQSASLQWHGCDFRVCRELRCRPFGAVQNHPLLRVQAQAGSEIREPRWSHDPADFAPETVWLAAVMRESHLTRGDQLSLPSPLPCSLVWDGCNVERPIL